MKNIFALSLALIFAIPSRAGFWDLFPLGQRSYFADSLQTPLPVEMYLIDSVRPLGNMEVQYFNKALLNSIIGPCAASLIINDSYAQGLFGRDSLIQQGDTAFFTTPYGTLPTIVLPLASVGQSWVVQSNYPGNNYNQITVTCSSLGQRAFLGITDSVKVFTFQPNGTSGSQIPISAFQMVLSKSHGLLEFVPFELFQYHPPGMNFRSLKLVGFESGGSSTGFVQPGFHDFFHLHAGDVLVWELHNQPAWIQYPETYEYQRDSIISSVITQDSVVYYGTRTHYSADGSIVNWTGLLGRYVSSATPDLLQAGTNDIGITMTYLWWVTTDQKIWSKEVYHEVVEASSSDTVISCSFSSYGFYLDTTYCLVAQSTDTDDEFDLDTRAGLIRSCNNGIGSYCKTLIGSIINDIPDGDFTLGIGGRGQLQEAAVVAYPNPVQERLHVTLPTGSGPWQYEVLDALGRTWRSGMLVEGGIAVVDLVKGPYVLRLHSGERTSTSRFVKE